MKIVITIEVEGEDIKVSTETEETKESEKSDGGLFGHSVSDYARFFDEGCAGWTKDPEYNLMFLTQQQNYANDLLRAKGHLFLNEVYDMLGIPRTKAGQVVGWVYDKNLPIADKFVDFGLFDIGNKHNVEFVNGHCNTALIEPNVIGNIMDLI